MKGINKKEILNETKFLKWLKKNPNKKFCVANAEMCPVAQFVLEKTGVGIVEVGWGDVIGRNNEDDVESPIFNWNWPSWVEKFVEDFDDKFNEIKPNNNHLKRVSGKRIVRELGL